MTTELSILAPIGKRFSAKFIDTVITLPVGYSMMLMTSTITPTDSLIPLIPMYGFLIIYGLFADGMFAGQSIGKKLMKVKVVRIENDEPCSYQRSFARNITGFFWVIDLVTLLHADRRRVGDYLAKTKVVMAA